MDTHDAQTITHMPMKRRVRRKIDSLLASGNLSESGLQWLTQATDPFHDMPVSCVGYPDITATNSLVQVFNVTTTVTAPTSLGTGDTWDCHIFFNPVSPPLTVDVNTGGGSGPASVDNKLYRGVVSPSGNQSGQLTDHYLFGGVNCIGLLSGGNWTLPSTAVTNNGNVSLPVKACGGAWRLIGAGFEVVNTTASLYKGGNCISYRSPASRTMTHTQTPTFIVEGQKLYTSVVSMPPSTAQDAALYPTSRNWGAEEGAYVVCALNDSEVLYNRAIPGRQGINLLDADISTLTTGIPSRLVYAPRYKDFSGSDDYSHGQNQALPFDISGTVFSGLNRQTTLSVTARYVIERIPTVAEAELLVLTRPPSSYDPLAIELYSKVMADLPVAVRVADNPAGEWWNTILDGLEAVIPAVGTALSGLTGGLSIPVSAAATLGLAGIRKASDNHQKKNPNPPGSKVNRRQRGQKISKDINALQQRAIIERLQSQNDRALAKRKRKKPRNTQKKRINNEVKSLKKLLKS